MTSRKPLLLMLLLVGLLIPPRFAFCAQSVGVLTYKMKSGSEEWKWLEAGIADRLTTQLFNSQAVNAVEYSTVRKVASRVRWTPKMLSQPARLDKILKVFSPDTIVSGYYEIRDGQITVSTTILQTSSKRIVGTVEQTAKVEETVLLVQKLAAELIIRFTRKNKESAERVLAQLQPWTTDVSAAKALYEGLAAYDQGNYGDAWLKFWTAVEKDSSYTDANYWVAKTYYVMGRYDHAREAYEKVVNARARHPRACDAVSEYVRACENLGMSDDAMLKLYEGFLSRPDLNGPVGGSEFPVKNAGGGGAMLQEWLWCKMGLVADRVGRNDLALREPFNSWGLLSQRHLEIRLYHMEQQHLRKADPLWTVLRKANDLGCPQVRIEDVATGGVAVVCLTNPPNFGGMCLVAPTGCLIAGASVVPVLASNVTVHMSINVDIDRKTQTRVGKECDFGGEGSLMRDFGMGGFQVNVPPRVLLATHYGMQVTNPDNVAQPVKEFRVEVQLARVERGGSVEVVGDDAMPAMVTVDGAFGRYGPGLVGPLAAGKHKITVDAGNEKGPFGRFESDVVVKPDQTVLLHANFSWRTNTWWEHWPTLRLLGDARTGCNTSVRDIGSPPRVQADSNGVRVVWAKAGDLWVAESSDGRTFAAARKFGLPVSTGWTEKRPKLIRDLSGRFLLVFLSDRDGQGEFWPYVCWSRDLINWSLPVAICKQRTTHFDAIQDSSGRYLMARSTGWEVEIYSSRNAVDWELLPRKVAEGLAAVWDVQLVQREDGSYDLFLLHDPGNFPDPSSDGQGVSIGYMDKEGRKFRARNAVQILDEALFADEKSPREQSGKTVILCHSQSPDGSNWSAPRGVEAFGQAGGSRSVVAFRQGSRTVVLYTDGSQMAELLRSTDNTNKWEFVRMQGGPVQPLAAMEFNERFGWLIASVSPLTVSLLGPRTGPFYLSVTDMDAVFTTGTMRGEEQPVSGMRTERSLVLSDLEPPKPKGMGTCAKRPELLDIARAAFAGARKMEGSNASAAAKLTAWRAYVRDYESAGYEVDAALSRLKYWNLQVPPAAPSAPEWAKVSEVQTRGAASNAIPVAEEINMGGPTMRFVYIPTGAIVYKHQPTPDYITIGFYLGIHEVTREQFQNFADLWGYTTRCEGVDAARSRHPRDSGDVTWRSPGFPQESNHPVLWISWYDAKAFCEWMTRWTGRKCRLPMDLEWEYACRGGTTTRYYWGNEFDGTKINYADRRSKGGEGHVVPIGGYEQTAPVGSFPPNPWGLYDMFGNAMEWCGDWPENVMGVFCPIQGKSWDMPPNTFHLSGICLEPDKASRSSGFRVLMETVQTQLDESDEGD